jgi:sugar O-acyltransferase (sialic acid O-acetyltransferase NeuD family)
VKPPLVVFGCGGHGKVVADAAMAAGYHLLGFADHDPQRFGAPVFGATVVATGIDGALELCRREQAEIALAIGDNRNRAKVFAELVARSARIASIVHPRSVIAPSARLGVGTVLFAGVVVNADAEIGTNVILNTGATVDHDNWLGDHVHLSPGVHLGGTVRIGSGTHLGVGVSVRNNITIGAWSVVGVGASVVKDLPDHVVAYGTPAVAVGATPALG